MTTSAGPSPHRFGSALVTGGGRRIGAAVVRALAAQGRPVAIHANASRDEAERLAAELRQAGCGAAVVVCDLADPAAPARLVTEAAQALGPLSALVNCASSFDTDAVGALDAAAWDRQMAVNLRAPVFLAEAFAAQIAPDGKGCVVNILDQRVLKPTPRHVSYTLSKAALMTATVTLAQALAPRARVVAVCPGPTLASFRQSVSDFERQSAAVPLGRGPTPEEIAAAVTYLVGADSVTGAILPVDGGQHLAWRTPDTDE